MPKKQTSLLPIYLTVFLDMLGIGIIIPVIPALFFEGMDFFPAGIDREYRSVMYGLLIAAFPLMQFFGAPLLGALSDRYGRKPLLSIALIGTMFGYLLFAYAIGTGNLILLFISRMIPGFLGGNISIVYSSIADISESDEQRTKNFGMVGMMFGLGFILGPTLGGMLADETVVSWFNPSTPFLFTSILTFLNIILVRFYFNETLPSLQKGRIEETVLSNEQAFSWTSLFKGFRNVAASFKDSRLRIIFIVVLLVSIGFSFFTQFFAVLLIEKFTYSEKDIGFLFGWIGLWLVFTQGFFVRKLTKYLPAIKAPAYSLLFQGIFIALILVPDQDFWFYYINPVIAIAYGITSPNLTTIVSNQAGPERQGEVLGINQSMLSLGQILPPIAGGYLNAYSVGLPILFGGGTILIAWLVFVFIFRKNTRAV